MVLVHVVSELASPPVAVAPPDSYSHGERLAGVYRVRKSHHALYRVAEQLWLNNSNGYHTDNTHTGYCSLHSRDVIRIEWIRFELQAIKSRGAKGTIMAFR